MPSALAIEYAVSPLAARWAIFWRSSNSSFGRPIFVPFAFARAMPAFVRSLIFCASTFAKDESSAIRTLRTNSLSVARWAPLGVLLLSGLGLKIDNQASAAPVSCAACRAAALPKWSWTTI